MSMGYVKSQLRHTGLQNTGKNLTNKKHENKASELN